MDNSYQGYSNYETFAIHNDIHNTSAEVLTYWREVAWETWLDAEADQDFTRMQWAELILADVLKIHYEAQLLDLDDWQGTLLNAAFQEVNWMELARELLADAETTG